MNPHPDNRHCKPFHESTHDPTDPDGALETIADIATRAYLSYCSVKEPGGENPSDPEFINTAQH